MKINKKVLLGSAVAALLSSGAVANAQAVTSEDTVWQARTVEEVKQDLVYQSENEISYSVKYGDTLGVISEAINVPLDYLAIINEIENVDLIFPKTILMTTYNVDNRADSITVEAPSGDIVEVELPAEDSTTEDLEVSFVSETVVEEIEEAEVETTEEAELVGVAPAAEFLVEEAEDTVSTLNYVESQLGQPVNNTIEFAAESVEFDQEIQAGLDQDAEIVEEDLAAPNLMTEDTAVEFEEVTPVIEEVVEVPQTIEEAPQAVETPQALEPVEETYQEVVEAPQALEPVETPQAVDEVPQTIEETPEVVDLMPEPTPEPEPAPEPEPTPEPVQEPVVTDPYANPQNAGLTENAASFKEEVTAVYGVEDFSLVRPGDPGDHGSGRAVDFMVYSDAALGNQIADYSISNMAANGISYVIWQQQIYGDWNQQWVGMEDRGSITANHYDHVHVSFH